MDRTMVPNNQLTQGFDYLSTLAEGSPHSTPMICQKKGLVCNGHNAVYPPNALAVNGYWYNSEHS
jgi:hypothetical protein